MATLKLSPKLEFYLYGQRILEGAQIPYRVFSLMGLTNPERFPLDIHNPSDVPIHANGVEIGLILPPELNARPSHSTIWLPDGRRMLQSKRVAEIPAKGWRSLRFKHVPRNPRHYRGRTLATALRIFDAGGMQEIQFGLQPMTGVTRKASEVNSESPLQRPHLPASRYDPASLSGAFVERLVQQISDHDYKIMVRGVDPALWYTRGLEIYACLRNGESKSQVVDDLRNFFGPDAGDALYTAVMEVLWPALTDPNQVSVEARP